MTEHAGACPGHVERVHDAKTAMLALFAEIDARQHDRYGRAIAKLAARSASQAAQNALSRGLAGERNLTATLEARAERHARARSVPDQAAADATREHLREVGLWSEVVDQALGLRGVA